jgi:NAD(P)-dependent dehydrogenase (short-subunit alcohol dehydrogenase family)
MDLHLAGKTALITGSSSGIGLAAAANLAAEGATVILNGRSSERLHRAEGQLRAAEPDASIRAVVADVGTEDGVNRLTSAEPRVDILVNNAGIYAPDAFPDITDDK